MGRVFKTVRRLTGSKIYRKWSEWAEGEYIVGKLVSVSVDNYGKNNYQVEVVESNFDVALAGKTMGLNANGLLDSAFSVEGKCELKPEVIGKYFKIEYQGMSVLTSGKFAGKESHSLDISEQEVEEDDLKDF